MSGFKLNLKGKGLKKPLAKSAFGVNKPISKPGLSRNFTTQESDEDIEDEITAIDNFGKHGATHKGKSISRKTGPLVIKMEGSSRKFGDSEEERIRNSLINGNDQYIDGKTIEIDKANSNKRVFKPLVLEKFDSDEEVGSDDYNQVPVEEFGAALLRGMGWKPNQSTKSLSNENLENRKKGLVLGIGAEAIQQDIMEEINGKKGDIIQVPLVKKMKNSATGNVIH